ncbi:MAG: hypothetical protein WKF55_08210 [Gemmatimonadaceae bacterium]
MAISRSRAGLFAMLCGIAGCIDGGPAGPSSTSDNVPSAQTEIPVQTEILLKGLPGEKKFNALAQQISGFGGYYTDGNANLHVVLTDLSQTDLAKNAVQQVFAGLGPSAHFRGAGGRAIIIHQGVFTFRQLDAWRDALFRSGAAAGVLHAIDLDEGQNRIVAGAPSAAAATRLRGIAEQLQLPAMALEIRVAPPERDLTDSLRGYVSPHAAGLKIVSYNANKECSLGFNTLSGRFFVTNSHCTRYRGQEYSNQTIFYQPDAALGTVIGQESDDPSYFSAEVNEECPTPLSACRYSDAALFVYSSFSAPGSAGQGRIWRPLYAVSGPTGDGPTEISGTLTITAEVDRATQFQTLDKVGASTGWTYGPVVSTCVNSSANSYWYLCQDVVSAGAGAGDSGSPVFQYTSPIFDEVSLYGVLRGYSSTFGGFVFSQLGSIHQELGYLPATS